MTTKPIFGWLLAVTFGTMLGYGIANLKPRNETSISLPADIDPQGTVAFSYKWNKSGPQTYMEIPHYIKNSKEAKPGMIINCYWEEDK